MACSCRSKKAVNTVFNAQTQAHKVVDLKSVTNQIQQADVQQAEQVSAEQPEYDFGFSTRPIDVCTHCAMKHTAFAAVLWKQSFTGLDKYLACGQLMCAASHYTELDASRSHCWRQAAQFLLSAKQDTVIVDQLLEASIHLDKDIAQLTKKVAVPFKIKFLKQNLQRNSFNQVLLSLSNAYALLFAQMGYLDLNLGYAIGMLQRSVFFLQRLQKKYQKLQGIAFKIRQLWKLVQQMTYMDDIYKQCRQRLQQILKTVIEVFQQQV